MNSNRKAKYNLASKLYCLMLKNHHL